MGLTGRFLTASVLADIAASTASAGTMMERIGGRAQGQMPQGPLDFSEVAVASKKMGNVPSAVPALSTLSQLYPPVYLPVGSVTTIF
jgi:hypothetical protein